MFAYVRIWGKIHFFLSRYLNKSKRRCIGLIVGGMECYGKNSRFVYSTFSTQSGIYDINIIFVNKLNSLILNPFGWKKRLYKTS